MSARETLPLSVRYLFRFIVLVLVGLALLVGAPRVRATGPCVNPGGTSPCYATIKAAIAAALAGDTITVAAGTYYEHDIRVDKSLTIIGAGPGSTIVDGEGLNRVFNILIGNSVYIAGVTIRNGVLGGGPGGGILNAGTLTLEWSAISNNTATSGGGIANTGTLNLSISTVLSNTTTFQGGGGIQNGSSDARMTLYNVLISNNRTLGASRIGGGISMYNGSQATLRFVTLSSNGAGSTAFETTNSGGGIYADTSTALIIDQSAIISNTITGGSGAGIYNQGAATLTNVTISGNSGNGVNGGGIHNFGSGTVSLLNSTIVSNTLTGLYGSGGGINNGAASATSVQIMNTIVSNNTAVSSWSNCYGAVYSLSHNLENQNSCGLTGTGDLPNTNPRIALLGNYGGPTMTHALLIGSPAIDGGTNSGCPSVDQRGGRRPLGARCDIGAYEAAMVYLPLLIKSSP